MKEKQPPGPEGRLFLPLQALEQTQIILMLNEE